MFKNPILSNFVWEQKHTHMENKYIKNNLYVRKQNQMQAFQKEKL